MLHLNTIQQLITPFAAQCDSQWKPAFEYFKKQVHSKGRHIFVYEYPKQYFVYLVYMHPQVTKNMSLDFVRNQTKHTPCHSVTLHAKTKQIVHCFGAKPFVYRYCDSVEFVEETVYFAKFPQTISYEIVPFGLTFCARWWDGEWVLGTSTIPIANQATFGTFTTLMQEFVKIYTQQAIDELDKTKIHTFRMVSNAFVVFCVNESVELIESRDPADGSIVSSYQFKNIQEYTYEGLTAELARLANLVSDEAVLNRYSETGYLIGSVLVQMGQYLIQIDSQVQDIFNACVQHNAISKEKTPFAAFFRDANNAFTTKLTEHSQKKTFTIVSDLVTELDLDDISHRAQESE